MPNTTTRRLYALPNPARKPRRTLAPLLVTENGVFILAVDYLEQERTRPIADALATLLVDAERGR